MLILKWWGIGIVVFTLGFLMSIISDYLSQEVNVLLNGCIIALSFYLLCGGLAGLILYALWGR